MSRQAGGLPKRKPKTAYEREVQKRADAERLRKAATFKTVRCARHLVDHTAGEPCPVCRLRDAGGA